MPARHRISHVIHRLRSSLFARLLLAILSGLPVGYLLGWTGYVFHIEGVMLGTFVLAPAIRTRSFFWLRISAAIGLGILGTFALVALHLSLNWLPEISFNGFETLAAGFVATLVLLLALAPLASLRMTRQFLGMTLAVSVCAGLTFYVFVSELWRWLCFDPCPWWNDLAFKAAWVTWHVEICLAIYFVGNADDAGSSSHPRR